MGSTTQVAEYWLQKAIDDIKTNYGHTVSIEAKAKDLLKFGRNPLIGTSEATVMDLPSGVLNETYVASNLITTVSSSSGSDTTTAIVEGHTVDANGDFTFVEQTVTLTGQSQVALGTALARVTRAYASGSANLVGAIYFYETDTATAGVPDTGSKVHMIIPAGKNQSRKASTTIDKETYWIVLDFDADLYDKGAAYAEVTMQIREKGKVFRAAESLAVNSGAHADHEFRPYKIIRPNSDVRLVSIADNVNTDVGGMIQGVLAKIV